MSLQLVDFLTTCNDDLKIFFYFLDLLKLLKQLKAIKVLKTYLSHILTQSCIKARKGFREPPEDATWEEWRQEGSRIPGIKS